MPHAGWATAVAVALLLGASVAGAGPEATEREAERTALFEEGVKLAEAGRWPEAVERFRRVVAMRSAPRVRFTLGEAEEKSGKLASAKASYTLALKEARATGDEQAAGAAGVALAAIERRVPRLVLRLTGRVAGARASVDGQEVKLTERGVELDPGEHRVQVRAPGRKPFERGVSVSEGRTVELAVRLEPERAAGPVATGGRGPQTAELGGPAGAWGPPAGAWVLGATGLAATVVGGVLYATGQGAYDEAAGACAAGGCAEPKHADDANAARRQMVAGDVLMVVGLGAIAGGGLWWAVSAGSGAEPPAPARHGVGVVASSGGFAVTFGGKL